MPLTITTPLKQKEVSHALFEILHCLVYVFFCYRACVGILNHCRALDRTSALTFSGDFPKVWPGFSHEAFEATFKNGVRRWLHQHPDEVPKELFMHKTRVAIAASLFCRIAVLAVINQCYLALVIQEEDVLLSQAGSLSSP